MIKVYAIWQRGEEHLKHVSNEACSNVRNCKMTTMPSLTLTKKYNCKGTMWGNSVEVHIWFAIILLQHYNCKTRL